GAFPKAVDDATGKTDIVVRSGWLWNWAVVTATEYHENEGRLTRLRVLARPQGFTRALVLAALVLVPVAIVMGFGFGSKVVTLVAVYAALWALSRIFMRLRRRRFRRIAASVGLVPV
ncbi:MAG TPA: hypothetical protein PLA50_17325, partial [Bacteroidia bacterium]|nr:hypothetical protein [Bacteroidia bacterium]